MNNNHLSTFIESIKEDVTLRQQLQKAESEKELIAMVLTLASERGLDFSEEEVRQEIRVLFNTELDEEGLDTVIGGVPGDSRWCLTV